MATLRPIAKPLCRECSKTASQELVSRFNELLGFYCGNCGRKAEEAQNAKESSEPAVKLLDTHGGKY